jgi:hypothetical protein
VFQLSGVFRQNLRAGRLLFVDWKVISSLFSTSKPTKYNDQIYLIIQVHLSDRDRLTSKDKTRFVHWKRLLTPAFEWDWDDAQLNGVVCPKIAAEKDPDATLYADNYNYAENPKQQEVMYQESTHEGLPHADAVYEAVSEKRLIEALLQPGISPPLFSKRHALARSSYIYNQVEM